MKEIDKQKLFGFARMSANRFDHLLEPIKPMILKRMQLEHLYQQMKV